MRPRWPALVGRGDLRIRVVPHIRNLRTDRGDGDNRADHDQAADQTPLEGLGALLVADETGQTVDQTLHGFTPVSWKHPHFPAPITPARHIGALAADNRERRTSFRSRTSLPN